MVKKHNKKVKNNKDQPGLVSYDNFVLPPVVPGPEVGDLCIRVDDFYSKYPKQHKKQKASDLIKSAFYAMRPECRSNADRVSQAASSARDVLYPLFSKQISSNNLIKLFKKYAISQKDRHNIRNREFLNTFDALDRIYRQLSDLTHHGTNLTGFSLKQFSDFSESDFENLMKDFTIVLGKAFSFQQIYIHTIVDVIIQKKRRPKGVKNDLDLILKVNPDARQYFYSKSDERWLNWLWQYGFLDVIKKKAVDLTHYGYKTPELNYLVRMAVKAPSKVVNIIIKVPISLETFNPEVVDRFLQICNTLPADQLARVVKKIRDERWIPLMGTFNQWGYQYGNMFKALAEKKDYDNIILLAEALLVTRTEEEIKKTSRSIINDNPFYFEDLEHTKVFEYLVEVDLDHKEKALAICIDCLRRVVLTAGSSEGENTFRVPETFHLFDVDFFQLKLGEKGGISHQDDVRSLAAVVTISICELLKNIREDIKSTRALFSRYFASLPDARSLWRLRLFVLSQNPSVFKTELKTALFRLFETKRFVDIIGGAEYEQALQLAFPTFDNKVQREYVIKVFDYFKKYTQEDGDQNDQRWYKEYGWRLLSSIRDGLTDKEKIDCETFFGKKWDPSFKPSSTIVTSPRFGIVKPRGPITLDVFGDLPIANIAKQLRNEWTPEKLNKQDTQKDIHNPLNAEGAGNLLKLDIPRRLSEYVNSALLFFERGALDQHYTYSFFWGIEETLRENKVSIDGIDWGGLIKLCLTIVRSGEKQRFEKEVRDREIYGAWLVGWIGVHSAMADVLLRILEEKNGNAAIDFNKHRNELFLIIGYLLKYRNPVPKDEEPKTAKLSTKSGSSDEYLPSDPFTMAINTVRGRAFQVFMNFVYQDSKLLDPAKKLKISNDTKKLYEEVLKNEDTQALMFMFGRNLAQFYYRDKAWITSLLLQIFPTQMDRQNLYLAAWEGYLSMNLFEEMFFDKNFQQLYERAITLSPTEYPKRRYAQELDEGLGIHLALAFTHYESFGLDSPLSQVFWRVKNSKRFGGFISLIGRLFVSGDNKQANALIKEEPASLEKIKSFWDWAIKHCDVIEALKEFGFWMNSEKKIFDLAWQAKHTKETLEKTGGAVDWDYGLSRSIVDFAKAAPKQTLDILRLHLLEAGLRSRTTRLPFSFDDEWLEAFKILYGNLETRGSVDALINNLISEGGSPFWPLKEAQKP